MGRKKQAEKAERQPTEREQRITVLRAIPKEDRSTEERAELVRLVSEEKRNRFLRLHPKRVARLKSAVRGIINIASAQSYQYTEDEAAAIVKAAADYAAEVKRAFTGTPKEKGLYDL